jgi:cobalt-zinc-cadmium efflux system protein
MQPHHHDHSAHHPQRNSRMLGLALALTVLFMLVECVCGYLAGSLALLADAGHMVTDAAALTLALAAVHLAHRAPDRKRSFGYRRLQVLATFVNGVALLLIVGLIAVAAVGRLLHPVAVNAPLMLWVAVAGALANIAAFALLRHGDRDDMNIAAAGLHVLSDLLGSLGAIGAALVIYWTGWTPVDPLLSLLLAGLIVRSAWLLVRKSTHILLEGAPDWLDIPELRNTLRTQIPAIVDVHHVHCWSLSPRETLLTLHATVQGSADHPQILAQTQHVLAERFGITHATIQLEYGPCGDNHCHS